MYGHSLTIDLIYILHALYFLFLRIQDIWKHLNGNQILKKYARISSMMFFCDECQKLWWCWNSISVSLMWYTYNIKKVTKLSQSYSLNAIPYNITVDYLIKQLVKQNNSLKFSSISLVIYKCSWIQYWISKTFEKNKCKTHFSTTLVLHKKDVYFLILVIDIAICWFWTI